MKVRECRAQIKAVGGDGADAGTFTALVSVFGNEDSYGDVVLPGAFTDTLAEWKASGNPIPVIWSHDWADPDSHLGWVTDARETEKGLEIDAQIDPADLADPRSRASKVYRLLKGGRVTQFSFAYDVIDGGFGTADGRDVYELRTLKLYEVGPTLIGANQETELLAVKAAALASAAVKEGRVLAAKHVDALRSAHDAIGAVIAAASSTEDDTKSSAAPAADQPEEQTGQPAPPANENGPRAESSASRKRLSPAVVRASVIAAPELI